MDGNGYEQRKEEKQMTRFMLESLQPCTTFFVLIHYLEIETRVEVWEN